MSRTHLPATAGPVFPDLFLTLLLMIIHTGKLFPSFKRFNDVDSTLGCATWFHLFAKYDSKQENMQQRAAQHIGMHTSTSTSLWYGNMTYNLSDAE